MSNSPALETPKRDENSYSFRVQGMTCASCVRIVEKNLKKVPGVEYVSVNLGTEKAYVLADTETGEEQLREAVEKSGYGFSTGEATENLLEQQYRRAKRNMIAAAAVTVPLMVLMIFHMAGVMIPGFYWMELAAAGFVLAYSGRGVFRSAWIAGIHLHSNMDTLVALGTVSAWTTTLLAVIGVDIFSFGTIAAMIVAFHLTGRFIEARLKERASREIRDLIGLKQETARIEEEGTIREIPVVSVKPGARVVARTGERIPLDGEVAEGEAAVDESMISGEPLPERKVPGDELLGGTLVTSGVIRFTVTRTGEDTFLSQMIKLIEEAQSQKVPIQATADTITKVFIPIVLLLAAAAGLFWGLNFENLRGFLNTLAGIFPWIDPSVDAVSMGVFVFVATLVIACPCALGLATPMALITGSGVAARKGLIIRSGDAIQTAKDLEIVVLDKTGTITRGEPVVIRADVEDENLRIAGELELQSVHPLAKAVLDYTGRALEGSGGEEVPGDKEGAPEISTVEETAGEGIEGTYRGMRYFLGRPRDPELYREETEQGRTVVEMRGDGRILGVFVIEDPIKEGAAEAVAALEDAGLTPVMCTGDDERTARAVAAAAGIKEVRARVRPAEKVAVVREFQKRGKKVAMIGDGINDAAALKSADVGIAIGTGTDLAIDSADIVIVEGELLKALDAIGISRLTFKKIKQNLFWAFFYNMAALPLAMSGILYPAIAEAAMIFSSINVILNSGRIRSYS